MYRPTFSLREYEIHKSNFREKYNITTFSPIVLILNSINESLIAYSNNKFKLVSSLWGTSAVRCTA